MVWQLPVVSRWWALTGGIFIACAAGTGYAYSLFTGLFKDRLHYTQTEVDLVGTIGNFGLYTNLTGGLFFNRRGPRPTLFVAAILVGIGFWGMWLAVNGHIPHPPLMLGLWNAIAQHGSGWLAAAAVATSVRNYPQADRGRVVGLTKGFFALSSSLLTQLYQMYFDPRVTEFLAFLGTALPVLCIVCILPLNLIEDTRRTTYAHDPRPAPSFTPWILVSLCTAVVVTVFGVLRASAPHVALKVPWTAAIGACLAVLCLGLPAHYAASCGSNRPLPSREVPQPWQRDSSFSVEEEEETEGLTVQQRSEEALQGGTDPSPTLVTVGLGLPGILWTADFHLLWVSMAVGAGSGLLVINNLAQITESVYPSTSSDAASRTKTVLVSFFGVANFSGRLLVGYVSDRIDYPRPIFLAGALLGLTGSFCILLLSSEAALYPAVLLVGCCYGAIFATVAASIGDLFGPEHFAGNYGTADLAPSIGSLLIATVVAGRVYQAHTPHGESVCYGPLCYRLAFIVAAVCCASGIPLVLILCRRMRAQPKRHYTCVVK